MNLKQINLQRNKIQFMCLLSMWSSNNKNFMSAQQKTAVDIEKAMKDVRMNPFEGCKQVIFLFV